MATYRKAPTRKDVAQLAGVSETIVSYVLNNNRYVAKDKRERVLEAVRRVMPYCFAPRPYPGVPCIELHEVRPYEPFDVRGLQVIPVRLMHACLPILGYRIGNVAYLTDAKTVDERAIEQLGGLDVLVLNALRKKEHMSHLSLDESLVLARRIGAKKTFLIHMSHEIGLHDTVQRTLPDGVVLAYDGLEAEVDG